MLNKGVKLDRKGIFSILILLGLIITFLDVALAKNPEDLTLPSISLMVTSTKLLVGSSATISCLTIDDSNISSVIVTVTGANAGSGDCSSLVSCLSSYQASSLGTSIVTCTARDINNNEISKSINIEVKDEGCVSDFECEEWSKCSTEGIQNRNCRDKNHCKEDKPETKSCDNIECVNNNDCKENYECKNSKCKLEGSENVTDDTFTILNDNSNENISDNATFMEQNNSLLNSSNLTTALIFTGLGIILLFTFMSLLINGIIKRRIRL